MDPEPIDKVPEDLKEEIKNLAAEEVIDPKQILIPTSKFKPTITKDRFTVKLDAYWEIYGQDPIGQSLFAVMEAATLGNEPYIRNRLKVTTEVQELGLGDISREDVGYIFIVNTEGTKLPRNPSKAEKKKIKERIVVFNNSEIHPYGFPYIGHVTPTTSLEIFCKSEQAIVQVYIFPR